MREIYLDFEFFNSNEPVADIVSAVTLDPKEGKPRSWWLLGESPEELKEYLEQEPTRLIAWQLQAELSSLLSLGINIDQFETIDLAAEWKLLKNRDNSFTYGRVFLDKARTKIGHSTPGGIETRDSLADVLLHQLDINLNVGHKDEMRNLILSRGKGMPREWVPFSYDDKIRILEYNASDVHYLPTIRQKFDAALLGRLPHNTDILKQQVYRGEYIKSLAKCERLGCPLDMGALLRLSKNHDQIIVASIEATNAIFPVFLKHPKTGKYQFKMRMFTDELGKRGLLDSWQKTDKGNIKKDEQTLSDNRHIPEIDALHNTNKVIQQLKWFRHDAIGEFMSRVGSDGHLRSYLGPYGTQTGRNAAQAKTYIFAMSSWLRCLIRPLPGWAITGVDYSSQEFAVAAALSGDAAMREAYESRDPYLYFAKAAGAVPPDGTREEYSRERDLFKATTLGLQYGMGVAKLARKLSIDMQEEITIPQARQLINLHRKIFSKYWEFLDTIQNYYEQSGSLILEDDWALWGDNTSALSVRNFPIQGTGASIMRLAVTYAHKAGLQVITPLHDAMYIYHKEEDTESHTEILKDCMTRAAAKFVDIVIRLDSKTVRSDSPWVETKGKKDFENFKKFLYPDNKSEVPDALHKVIGKRLR